MKKILFVLVIVLLSSCACEDTIVPITDGHKQKSKADEYYWYYDNNIFEGTFYIRGKDPCITTIELN